MGEHLNSFFAMGGEDDARLACPKSKTASVKDAVLGQLNECNETELKATSRPCIKRE